MLWRKQIEKGKDRMVTVRWKAVFPTMPGGNRTAGRMHRESKTAAIHRNAAVLFVFDITKFLVSVRRFHTFNPVFGRKTNFWMFTGSNR